jgi:hypothetical protein
VPHPDRQASHPNAPQIPPTRQIDKPALPPDNKSLELMSKPAETTPRRGELNNRNKTAW